MENLDFNFKVVTSGQKSIASTPELKVTSAQNHFNLNSVAADLMGVKEGDRVLMLHMPNEDPDARFFITKAVGDEKSALLGGTGSTLHFNYSGIYGAVYMNDAVRAIVSIKELHKNGLYGEFVTPKGNKALRGLMTIDYTLESVGEHDINGTVRPVFALTNRVENSLVNENSAPTEIEEEA